MFGQEQQPKQGLLVNVKDKYYQTMGNALAATQGVQARLSFTPEREKSYVYQMGRTPFSLRMRNYKGENISTPTPAIASKAGRTLPDTIGNYLNQIRKQPADSNRVLVRTHTHPTRIAQGNGAYLNLRNTTKAPSPQDFVNAASVYTLPQNRELKYNVNKIYTKENGKNVDYTFDVPDSIKQKMRQEGDIGLLKYSLKQNLGLVPEQLKAAGAGWFDALRGKGHPDVLSNQYLNQNMLKKYQGMGYPVTRKESWL